MKGQTTFTSEQAAELRRLLSEKQTADRSRQKTLRGRMRAIGFYITDFATNQQGFVVSDFDDLASRGVIRISDEEENAPAHAVRRKTPSGPRRETGFRGRSEARARRESAARKFKPEKIDLLLVAEAPPSALDRYFYFLDVREQDSLFRYVCRALLRSEPTRAAKAELLAELRDRGVFLIDMQEEPRDGTELGAFVSELVKRCERLNPAWIVLIKATVFDAGFAALAEAGLPVSSVRVPFPGSGQQRRFLESFDRALKERPNR
jgi:hypothetical protein